MTAPGDVAPTEIEAPPASFGGFRRRTAETFVSLVISTIAAAAYAVLVARTVGPSGKGVISVLFLLPTLAALVLVGSLELANTYFGARTPRLRPLLLGNGLTVSSLGGVAAAAAIFGALYAAHASFGATWAEVAILGGTIVPTSISRIAVVLLLAEGRTLAFNVVGPLVQIAMLAFTAAAFAALGSSVSGVVYAYAASQVLAAVAALWTLRLRPAGPSRPLLGESMRYGVRGMLANLVQFFNYRLDFFLLSSIRSPAAVGVYSISVTLAELVLKIPTAASTILLPRIAASRGEDDGAFTAAVSRTISAVAVVACVALLVGAKLLIVPIFGSAFGGAFIPLVLLLPGVVALSITNVLASDFAGRGHPEYLTYSALIGLVFTIVLNIALVPPLGASGAALASTASYAAAAVFVVAAFARQPGRRARDLVPRPEDLAAWKTRRR